MLRGGVGWEEGGREGADRRGKWVWKGGGKRGWRREEMERWCW